MSRKESTLVHYTAENSELPTNEVRALLWDRQRRIWVGTSRGLVRLIPTGLRQYDRDDGLRETDVTAVYATPGGTLWFGHPDGRVGYLDSSGVSYPPRDAYAGRICAITSMGQDTNQLVFCASDSGITVYDDSLRIERLTQRSGLPTGPVINLLAARDTPAVWIVCRDGIARVTDRDTLLHVENFALPEGEVTAVARHPAGGLLLATTVSSVFHWRADTILAGMATYSPEGFTALAVRRGSQLWALRESEGLFYTDLRMRVPAFAPVGTHRGFDSRETVHLLVPPDKPELWLGTEKELIRLFLDRNGQPDWVKRYGRGEGYPGGRVQASAIDEQGTIWFGTTRGLVRYGGDNPNRFLDPPPTHLAAINVFYTPVDSVAYERWDGKPRFTPQDNHFHFRFRAVDLTYPERVRYHYRLRGEQTEWSPLTAETSVRYAGLTPGSYAFAVQATTDGGNTWGEPATYSFTIARPLIKEGWFLTLLTLVGIGLLVSIFYAFYRRVERREAARRVALEAR
ncbi:MAG: two-component regulator propeller domain-containing protein, partial [Bacteroidota bacterium]